MRIFKSILLGASAAIAGATATQAADLPTKKAPPIEFVRICDWAGSGFFYIPGTQTCLKVGGRMRAEYRWQNSRNTYAIDPRAPREAKSRGLFASKRYNNETGFRTLGRVEVDARTQTAWGLLRAFVRMELVRESGSYVGLTARGVTQSSSLDQAYIQWAGITAGRVQSFYDFYANSLNMEALHGSDASPSVLAYTATFGGGWTATISIEDRQQRPTNFLSTPVSVLGTDGNLYAATGDRAGYRLPALIGALRLEQGWGAAQLSAAAVRNEGGLAWTQTGSVPLPPNGQRYDIDAQNFAKKNVTGYAVQGGVQINLPMLAAGDQVWLQGAWARAALSYVGAFVHNAGGVLRPEEADGVAYQGLLGYAANGAPRYSGIDTNKTKAWSIIGGLLHYWTPTVRQAIFASYAKVNYHSYDEYDQATRALYRDRLLSDMKEWRVGSNVFWSPVAGLDIGFELMYAKNQSDRYSRPIETDLADLRASGFSVKRKPDMVQLRLRLQRDF